MFHVGFVKASTVSDVLCSVTFNVVVLKRTILFSKTASVFFLFFFYLFFLTASRG